LGLHARQIVALTLVAVAVAAATSVMNASLLVHSRVREIRDAVRLHGQGLYLQTSRSVRGPWGQDRGQALRADTALRNQIDALVGYSPIILYVAVTDTEGVALVHSNPDSEGRPLRPVESLDEFAESNLVVQLVRLGRGDRTLGVDLPSGPDGRPRGRVRVAVSALLLKRELWRAITSQVLVATAVVLVAFLGSLVLANWLLAPLDRLREELSRIDTGEGRPRLDLRSVADVGRIAEFFATVGRSLADLRTGAEADRWMNAMLRGLKDAVLVVSGARRVLGANEPACRLLGLGRGEVEGRSIDDIAAASHPVRWIVEDALRRGEDADARRERLEVGGRPVEYLFGAHVLREGGRVSGVMVTARNLEELSRLTQHLLESRRVDALGQMASAVAHQIRSPLNAMVLHLAVLRERADGEAQRHLDVLEQEVRRLDEVIQGFLRLARPERVELQPVRLDAVVREVLERWAPRAEAGGVRLEPAIDADLPPVAANPELLKEALSNIMANAVDAMPEGGNLRVALVHRAGGGVVVSVRDSGGGIRPDVLPRVFDPYFTTKEKGTGIGLALVRRIAELHGGEVGVDSAVGRGTTVTVTLPEGRG
jgi:PAS domain S-box-containing protein